MGKAEIHLDGSEISVIKALGLTGGEKSGQELADLLSDFEEMELIDTLKGMIMMGYVVADRRSFYDQEGLYLTNFAVNSGYSRDLKDAMDPHQGRPKSKRVRRE